MKVSGLKSDEYPKLKAVDQNRLWVHAVDKIWDEWRQVRHTGDRRIEPTLSLGMTDLQEIAGKKPTGKLAELEKSQVNEKELQRAAEEYGHPFELLYGLPKMIHEETSRTVKEEISSEVGRRVYPDIVTLVFRIVGALSLVVVVITLLIKFLLTNDLKAQEVIAGALVVVAIAAAVALVKLPWRSVGGQ